MSKKSQKFESVLRKPHKNTNLITFNRSSFDLGNIKILTDDLEKQTREMIIDLYRQKRFDKDLYKQKINSNDTQKNRKCIVLTEIQAKQIIKEVLQKEQCENLKPTQIMFSQYKQIINKEVHANQINVTNNKINYIARSKNFVRTLFQKDYNKNTEKIQIIRIKKQKNLQQLRQITQKACLKIQREIFIDSIAMIIQKKAQVINNQDDFQNTTAIVIFQQSYPPKQFNKIKLVKMIGQDIYQIKLLTALKVYRYFITHQDYYNPLFLVCHDCMKVIANVKFPQHDLNCQNKIDQLEGKFIKSEFSFTPYQYMKKIIQGMHFIQVNQQFHHSYIKFFSKYKTQYELTCGRHWCGYCIIDFKKGMDFQKCDFCDLACRCGRCKKFEKLVQLLGHYMNLGNKLQDIKKKFLFELVFESQEFNCKERNSNSFKLSNRKQQFPFMQQLQKMYESHGQIHHTKQWSKLQNFQIITGGQPQTSAERQLLNQWLSFDKMKLKTNVDQSEIMQQRKSYRKHIQMKKQQNIEAKIENLNEETQQRFIKAQFQQRMYFKDQLIKGGIIRLTNPLNDPFLNNRKKGDTVIIQQSQFRKNQRKLFDMVPMISFNPFKKVQKQNQFSNLRNQQMSNKNSNLIEQESKQSQDKKINQQNDSNNYGSMWS